MAKKKTTKKAFPGYTYKIVTGGPFPNPYGAASATEDLISRTYKGWEVVNIAAEGRAASDPPSSAISVFALLRKPV